MEIGTQRAKHRGQNREIEGKNMKRKISKNCLITFILGFCLWLVQPGVTVWAQAGKTSLAVSSGSVNIGDTVTVTARAAGASGEKAVAVMTVSYDTAVFKFVSCSGTYGGGGSSVTATGDSFSVTLKAVAAGDSKVSLSASDGVIFDTNEELDSMTGSSTTISVKNAAGTGGAAEGNQTTAGAATGTVGTGTTAGAGTATGAGAAAGTGAAAGSANGAGGDAQAPSEKLSADNSLQVLSLSAGTLSPAFTGKTVKYTATVPNNVTDLAVTATPVNEKAVVESVTGNKNLAVGENTVSVVVRAENGVTATYTIRVTREAAAAEAPAENDMPDPAPEEPIGEDTPGGETPGEETPAAEGGQTGGAVTIDGAPYRISQDFTAEEIPADFAEAEVAYQGTAYKGVSYGKGTPLSMLFLVPDADGETKGKFFFYDGTSDTFYPYVRFGGAEKYVFSIPLTADEAMQAVYQTATFAVPGEGTLQAYQENAEFYIFLALNQDGFGSYYRYDSVEGTYQRFAGIPSGGEGKEEEAAEENVEMEYLQQKYNELSDQYKKEKTSSRNVIAVLVFVAAVLLIVIVNLLLHRRGRGVEEEREDEDYEDYGDDFAAEEEETFRGRENDAPAARNRRKKKSFFSDDLDDDLEEEMEEEAPVLKERPSARPQAAERTRGEERQPMRRRVSSDEEKPAVERSARGEERRPMRRRVSSDGEVPAKRSARAGSSMDGGRAAGEQYARTSPPMDEDAERSARADASTGVERVSAERSARADASTGVERASAERSAREEARRSTHRSPSTGRERPTAEQDTWEEEYPPVRRRASSGVEKPALERYTRAASPANGDRAAVERSAREEERRSAQGNPGPEGAKPPMERYAQGGERQPVHRSPAPGERPAVRQYAREEERRPVRSTPAVSGQPAQGPSVREEERRPARRNQAEAVQSEVEIMDLNDL